MISNYQIVLRLVVATALGGLIGFEREARGRAAGFRTHILVCLSSSLIMLVSLYIFELYKDAARVDPSRIAAQVIVGIGFLGAGTIIRSGATIKGLTTAASLWAVAGIGLAVGCGFYLAAFTTTVLVFVTLLIFSKMGEALATKGPRKGGL